MSSRHTGLTALACAAAAVFFSVAAPVRAQSNTGAPVQAPAVQPSSPGNSAPAKPNQKPGGKSDDKTKPGAKPSKSPRKKSDTRPTALTSKLLYQLLVAELESTRGNPGDAYKSQLNAALHLRDPGLFRRAVEIALRAHDDGLALDAARLWRKTLPDSQDAFRFELQILLAAGRIGETPKLVNDAVAAASVANRPALLDVIGQNYARAADKQQAVAIIEQALDSAVHDYEPRTSASAWAAIGTVRLSAGDMAGAMDAAARGQQADPQAESPAQLALYLLGVKQGGAEPIVRRYLAQPGASAEIRLGYARALMGDGHLSAALEQVNGLVKQNGGRPKPPESLLLLAQLQAQMGGQDANAESTAQRYLSEVAAEKDVDLNAQQVASRKEGRNDAYFLLAQLTERRKDYAGAERLLGRIEGGERINLVQLRRAELLARQGKLKQARDLIQSLPERSAHDKDLKFRVEAQLLGEAQDWEGARALLETVRATAPKNADLIYGQALIDQKLGRFDEMEQLLRSYVQLKPNDIRGYVLLSTIAARRKDYAEADRWLARIGGAKQNLPEIQISRAGLLARQGKPEQARQLIRALPERNASDKRMKLQAELQVLQDIQDWQGAYELIAQARVSAPDDPDLVYGAAIVNDQLGRPEEMERLLRRFIVLKPDSPMGYNALGYWLADHNKRLREARTLIKKALELDPESGPIIDSMGWVEYRLGHKQEALRLLEDAYRRNPETEIGAHLGEVLWVSGQKERALKVWKAAQNADPDNKVLQETLQRLDATL
ncbi:MAG: tetratricopeptide repeat protein [Burkholderiaceae bacterium]|nr:tetratricopeptide repeat protein [Burkholderiaceae bacterium]